MFLKQIRTYIMIAIVLIVYGYFLYLPFRQQSIDEVIKSYANVVGNLHVDSPSYGPSLNKMLIQNVQFRGSLHRSIYGNGTQALDDEASYNQTASLTHQIQLDI